MSPKKYTDQSQDPERKKDTFVVVSNRQEKDDFVWGFFAESANVELIILKKNIFQNKEIFYEEGRGAIM